MPAEPVYLLDTNVLVHAVRESPTWGKIKATCDPLLVLPCPVISDVTVGEILSLAEQLGWGEQKTEQVAYFTSFFQRISVSDPEILRAYAMIDAQSRKTYSVKMGKNDLWIAATALVLGATLVTTDKDFDHLAGVYIDRILIEQVEM